jgi:HD-GYP domain-containing protein (c-di-GMP phosphodiesterase class II)
VRKHPYYSYEILRRIPSFADLSEIAASHHEKLDGTGYFRGATAEHLSLPARILVVADIHDALAAKRPYRDALPLEEVFAIMQRDAPQALDANVLAALKCSTTPAGTVAADLFRLSLNFQEERAQNPAGDLAGVAASDGAHLLTQ